MTSAESSGKNAKFDSSRWDIMYWLHVVTTFFKCRHDPKEPPVCDDWRVQLYCQITGTPVVMQPMVCAILAYSVYLGYQSVYFWMFWAVYATYIYFDPTPYQGGYSWQTHFWKSLCWKHGASYFPIKVHKTVDLPASDGETYCFACHPHGIIGTGAAASIGCDGANFSYVFPGLRVNLAVLKFCLRIPFARELFLSAGCVDVSRESIEWCLSHGRSVGLCPGGAKEAIHTRCREGPMKLISDRKGFCRLALKHGASVVPVITFGEMEAFEEYAIARQPWLNKLQLWGVKYTGFSMPLFHGPHWFFPLLPYRQQLDVCFGRPVKCDVKNVAELSESEFNNEVDKLHARFLEALTDDYYANRDKYGYGERDLVFISSKGDGEDGVVQKPPK